MRASACERVRACPPRKKRAAVAMEQEVGAMEPQGVRRTAPPTPYAAAGGPSSARCAKGKKS